MGSAVLFRLLFCAQLFVILYVPVKVNLFHVLVCKLEIYLEICSDNKKRNMSLDDQNTQHAPSLLVNLQLPYLKMQHAFASVKIMRLYRARVEYEGLNLPDITCVCSTDMCDGAILIRRFRSNHGISDDIVQLLVTTPIDTLRTPRQCKCKCNEYKSSINSAT